MSVEKTQSACPVCDEIVDASIVERGGDLRIEKRCPTHGASEDLYWKDGSLYREASKIVGTVNGGAYSPDLTKYILIDLTSLCNLNCPICYAHANDGERREPAITHLLERLPVVKTRTKPNVVLAGGEPTLRKDLPEIISAIRARGYVPKIVTNGIRLTEDGYLDTLKKSGLDWIMLQFDGFSDEIYMKLRGRELLQAKLEAIEKLAEREFRIQLSTMLVKGVNDGEIWKILEFALRSRNIFWVSFYPASVVGRYGIDDALLFPSEVMDVLERESGGRITRADFLGSMRLWNLLFRFTGNPMYKQKVCTYPTMLYSSNGECFPAARLLNPLFALSHTKAAVKLLLNARRLTRFESRRISKNFLFVTVEKFFDSSNINMVHANNCHLAVMTDTGFIPFCIYNARYRRDYLGISQRLGGHVLRGSVSPQLPRVSTRGAVPVPSPGLKMRSGGCGEGCGK